MKGIIVDYATDKPVADNIDMITSMSPSERKAELVNRFRRCIRSLEDAITGNKNNCPQLARLGLNKPDNIDTGVDLSLISKINPLNPSETFVNKLFHLHCPEDMTKSHEAWVSAAICEASPNKFNQLVSFTDSTGFNDRLCGMIG